MKRICMVGTGYVGLVTGAGLAKLGHHVTCVDIDPKRIQGLLNGHIPFFEKDLPQLVHDGVYADRLHFTTSLKEGLEEARYVIIAVATPQAISGEPDMSQVYAVLDQIPALAPHSLKIIVKSTVPVACFKELHTRLGRIKTPEKKFDLVSCPEFLAEGTAVFDFFNPTRTIVGATSEAIAREVGALFEGVSGPRIYTGAETAQIIKYASNSFLASRIAFINEIARICELFSVDVHQVERVMLLDPRFGKGYLTAGIGFGGACLPKDLAALIHTARTAGYEPLVCNSIALQNEQQIEHVVNHICTLAQPGNTVAIFGISFKAGTSDVRNSLAVKIATMLTEKDRLVVVNDPQALDFARPLLEKRGITCCENPWQTASGSDVQAFLTAWPEYKQMDLKRLSQTVRKPQIFDGSGLFDPVQVQKEGFAYVGIGRVGVAQCIVIE